MIVDTLLAVWFGIVCGIFGPSCARFFPDYVEVVLPPIQDTGLASYYGSDLPSEQGMHGQVTASGIPFDPSQRICASRSLPFGTIVVIERVRTGDWTWCVIEDRGPYGAILEDGSWAAMFRRGSQYVVRRRSGGVWNAEEVYDERPGTYRGIIDLSLGTAEDLGFDFDKGLNRIRLRYDMSSPYPFSIRINRT
jgi:hypothetical protein